MGEDPRPFLRTPAGLALLACSAALIFFRLGAGSLANGDDAVFASAVRAAGRHGAWLDYSWNGARLGFLYPPLHFVLIRAATALLGQSELALRLPAALAAWCAVLATGAIAHRLAGSARAGLVAGLLLCTSALFFDSARSVRLDATLLAFSTTCALAYIDAWRSPRRLWMVGVFGGLAVLTKGVLGFVPLVPIAADLCGAGRGSFRTRHLAVASLSFFLIAASWHCWQLLRFGSAFVDEYFVYSLFKRVQGIPGLGEPSRFWADTLKAEGVHVLAWALGVIWAVRRARAKRDARFLLIWMLCPLCIVSISGTRLPQYLVPALAPMAVACGLALSRFFERKLAVLAACALAVAAFLSTSLAVWLDPDLSPGVRDLAALARQRCGQREMVAFDEYHAALEYYADSPTVLVTDDARAYRLLVSPLAMQEGARVELVRPADVPRRIARTRPVCWMTSSVFEKRLRVYLGALPPDIRDALEIRKSGSHVLAVERETRPGAGLREAAVLVSPARLH